MHDPSSELARLPEHNDQLIALARTDAERWAERTVTFGGDGAPLDHAPARDAFEGYDLLDEVHRGAQGVVYRATHLLSGRAVAIKVIRSGPFAGERDAARFCREIEALLRLQHPNIVAIHDSGVAAGCFYFVMDYIAGRPLDEYIAATQPSIAQRLALFIEIAEAVHIAHLRGIIHRDLKPSNVRVDDHGCPHVLDFGLARFIADELSATDSRMTMTGQFVGSLPWASPEQAEGRVDALDLRTDVYSLGLLLYNMLSGDMPYHVNGHLRAAIETIVQTDPAPPRIGGRRIDEELETIVMKCLRKEAARRYQTAGELARDVRRHLAGDPIEAKRDSGWYMFKKTIHRHRALAYASLGMLFTILIVMVLSLFLWRAAVAQRHEAVMARQTVEVERDRAQAAELRAAEAAEHARIEADKAAEVTAFLQDMLSSADPDTQPAIRVTVREVLDQAAGHVDDQLADKPAVTAEIRETLANAYEQLGLLDNAEAQYRAAVVDRYEAAAAEASQEHRQVLLELARIHRHRGQYHAAEKLYRKLIAEADGRDNAETVEVADTLVHLGSVLRAQERRWDAQLALQHALDIYRQTVGATHPRTAAALSALGRVRLEQHELDKAEALFHEALAIHNATVGPDHPRTVQTELDLAALSEQRGEFDQALAMYEKALALYTAQDARDRVIDTLTQLALTYRKMGDYDRAEELYRDVLARQEARTDEPTARMALILDSLGWVMLERGEYDEAQRLLERGLAMRLEVFGEEHPYTGHSLDSLAHLALRCGNLDRAEQLFRTLLDKYTGWYGAGHVMPTRTSMALADILTSTGRFEEARALYHAALHARSATLGEDHVKLSDIQLRYATMLRAMGETAAAGDHARAALDIRRAEWGEQDWRTAEAASVYAGILLQLEQVDRATQLLEQALVVVAEEQGHDTPLAETIRKQLIAAYDASGRTADADALRNNTGK